MISFFCTYYQTLNIVKFNDECLCRSKLRCRHWHAPFQYVDWPEKEHEAQPPTYESHRCLIKDGRQKGCRISFRNLRLQVYENNSRVDDFYSANQISKIYDDEVASLIKSELEASRVIVFDHTFRTVNEKVSSEKNTRAPVKAVHNDYTDRSARQRVQDLLSKNDADTVLKKPFCYSSDVEAHKPSRYLRTTSNVRWKNHT